VEEGSHLAINHLGGKRGFDECLGIEPREDVIAKNVPPLLKDHHFVGRFPRRPLILLTVTSDLKMKYRTLLR
jgi:hypothetical protein